MQIPLYYPVETPLGEIYIYLENERPVHIMLSHAMGEEACAAYPVPEAVAAVVEAIREYFRGADIDHSLSRGLLDALPMTAFEECVLREVAKIPRGETASYGEVAERAGHPRAARAVGNVMHSNPFPIIIPCHRVIKSDGTLGGYGGSEHLKAWLLEFEGARCLPNST